MQEERDIGVDELFPSVPAVCYTRLLKSLPSQVLPGTGTTYGQSIFMWKVPSHENIPIFFFQMKFTLNPRKDILPVKEKSQNQRPNTNEQEIFLVKIVCMYGSFHMLLHMKILPVIVSQTVTWLFFPGLIRFWWNFTQVHVQNQDTRQVCISSKQSLSNCSHVSYRLWSVFIGHGRQGGGWPSQGHLPLVTTATGGCSQSEQSYWIYPSIHHNTVRED